MIPRMNPVDEISPIKIKNRKISPDELQKSSFLSNSSRQFNNGITVELVFVVTFIFELSINILVISKFSMFSISQLMFSVSTAITDFINLVKFAVTRIKFVPKYASEILEYPTKGEEDVGDCVELGFIWINKTENLSFEIETDLKNPSTRSYFFI